MATQAQITAQSRVQAGIVSAADVELRGFWSALNLDRPQVARDALLEFMPYLNEKYGNAAGTAAATYFDELREQESVSGRFSATVVEFNPEPTTVAARRIAGDIFDGQAIAAYAGLAAMAQKQITQMGRDTTTTATVNDPFASGWHREIRGDTCAFCRMLASRGAVYKESTASFAAHHNCDCVAVPSWDANAPEVSSRQYEASQRTSNMTEQQKADHRANVRRAVADFEG